MKKRLIASLATFLAVGGLNAATLQPIPENSDSLQWVDSPSLPAGAKVAVIVGDPSKKVPFVARIKLPANYRIPAHAHPINEYDTVLSGMLYIDANHKTMEVSKGAFVLIPAKLMHSTWTKEETVIQIYGVGPWGMLHSKQG